LTTNAGNEKKKNYLHTCAQKKNKLWKENVIEEKTEKCATLNARLAWKHFVTKIMKNVGVDSLMAHKNHFLLLCTKSIKQSFRILATGRETNLYSPLPTGVFLNKKGGTLLGVVNIIQIVQF
jgi:hypothetical protein